MFSLLRGQIDFLWEFGWTMTYGGAQYYNSLFIAVLVIVTLILIYK